MTILIVEDDLRVGDFLARGLKAEGYDVTWARTGGEGLALARHPGADLIVLDLILPGMRGTQICQELRDEGLLTPILMLTALDAVEDRVDGFRAGADDYLTKPFAFEELLARIEALIRRTRNFESKSSLLCVEDLAYDRDRLLVTRGDRKINLTAKELAILELLMSRPGKVVSRQRILSGVWRQSTDPLTNVVDVYIARLRKKIDSPGEPELISTVRGHGYRLGS
jgi:DNA-binding response OmpR family regulator